VTTLQVAWIVAVAIALVTLAGIRRWASRSIERRVDRDRPLNASGVLRGAESISLESNGPSTLLLHGFGDTPQSLGELAVHLHRRGWSVHVPRLPGHGGSLKAFAESRSDDWIAAADQEYERLRNATGSVAVVGQSMGAALALLLGARHQDVPAVVLLAPFLRMRPVAARLARMGRVAALVMPYFETRIDTSIHDPRERSMSLGFGVTTPGLLAELRRVADLAWAAAPSVSCPTLMIQSMLDPRISPVDGERVFERLGGRPKELKWLHGSGHVVAADAERGEVISLTAAWIERHQHRR
jgi:carboxylesterase